jgi:hypothetical protein
MKAMNIDGELIRWKERVLSNRIVEILIEGNTMTRHPVEAGAPQGSPVPRILFVIYASGLIKSVDQYVSATELLFVDDLSRVGTENIVNQVVT